MKKKFVAKATQFVAKVYNQDVAKQGVAVVCK
jgi:hypothetical protein